MQSRLIPYVLNQKKVKKVSITAGEDLILTDQTEYRGRNLSGFSINAYPSLPFQAYLQFTTAASGDIQISFPESQYYGSLMPSFGNGEAWEVDIKDGIVAARLLSNAFTITYSANGGSGSETDGQVYLYGDLVTLAGGSNLSYEGHNLSGWNTAADGSGTAYALGESLNIMDNLTLYAVWTVLEEVL